MTDDQQNAARYRWLRDLANVEHKVWDRIIDSVCSPEEMDALIDAAIAEKETR